MNDKQQQVESFPWHIWEEHQGLQRFHSTVGRPGRTISGRLLPGCDMLLGMIDMAKSHTIRSAWVSAFGSLARAEFSPGIRISETNSDRVERRPNVYLPGPLEMWSGMGRLGIPDTGEPFIHFHGLVATPEGKLYGGHFFPGESIVYATFEVHIQEILGVEFTYELDEVVEIPLIKPKGRPERF